MDLLKLFRDDPAGWTAVAIAIVTFALSAVFWRTTWSVLKAIGRGIRAVCKAVRKIRITTEGRIQQRVNAAIQDSHRVNEPASYWQWQRDPRPGIWRLENHTGETCTVMQIVFDPDLGWKWDAHPNFPTRVRDGWRIELRGRLSVVTNAPYVSDNPGATVRWIDSHGDEAVIWTPFKDGFKFF